MKQLMDEELFFAEVRAFEPTVKRTCDIGFQGTIEDFL